MKIVIFINTNQNRELIGKWDCSVTSEDGETLEWVSDAYSYKFVVTTQNCLIIGTMNNHVQLYAAFLTQHLPVMEAAEQIEKISKCPHEHRNNILAAGNVKFDGQVMEWESGGFRVKTPPEEQQNLQTIITELYNSGKLKPK